MSSAAWATRSLMDRSWRILSKLESTNEWSPPGRWSREEVQDVSAMAWRSSPKKTARILLFRYAKELFPAYAGEISFFAAGLPPNFPSFVHTESLLLVVSLSRRD